MRTTSRMRTLKLNTFEGKFAGFLGKTLLAGKHALDAVKDFNERNQITVKTALSDFKQNFWSDF